MRYSCSMYGGIVCCSMYKACMHRLHALLFNLQLSSTHHILRTSHSPSSPLQVLHTPSSCPADLLATTAAQHLPACWCA